MAELPITMDDSIPQQAGPGADIRVAAEQAIQALLNSQPLSPGPAECERHSAALASLEAALAAQPEQQQGQGLVHPAMSTSGRTSGDAAPNAPGAGGGL